MPLLCFKKSPTERALLPSTTALEALQGADLTGKVAVVTGGNSGLGVETCRALAYGGAAVVLCCRSVEAGQGVADRLQPSVKGSITVRALDLADLKSVASLAADLSATLPSLDLLILNAGVMALRPGPQRTKDGFERQFGVNHLGHFALTRLLLPKMKTQGTPGRVVVVASSAHKFGKIQLDDLNYERRRYGQSKLANILFFRELARRLREEGSALEAFCLHPGIVKTNIGAHIGWRASAYYALAAELAGHSGAYLQDCRLSAPAKHARDDATAAALWSKSEELVAAALKA